MQISETLDENLTENELKANAVRWRRKSCLPGLQRLGQSKGGCVCQSSS